MDALIDLGTITDGGDWGHTTLTPAGTWLEVLHAVRRDIRASVPDSDSVPIRREMHVFLDVANIAKTSTGTPRYVVRCHVMYHPHGPWAQRSNGLRVDLTGGAAAIHLQLDQIATRLARVVPPVDVGPIRC